jgi:hypothetical protein
MRCTGTAPARSMITRKAAGYGTLGAILVACLAAANMPSQDAARATAARKPRSAPPGPDAIAVEVRSQAARLHARISQAPAPDLNPRNPFAFVAAPRPMRPNAAMVHATVVEEPPAAVAPPPALTLMGIAEEGSPTAPRRTAILSAEGDDIVMATEGQLVLGRYKVTKIGVDAVELEEVATKAYRRLALR